MVVSLGKLSFFLLILYSYFGRISVFGSGARLIFANDKKWGSRGSGVHAERSVSSDLLMTDCFQMGVWGGGGGRG